ncbi:MAG TPA: hypothetical protein V6C96_03460 [Vampirovibrionales bacterium]
MNTNLTLITVSRDLEMYERFFTKNNYLENCTKICFDNNAENLGIPTRYNQFLDGYDYSKEAWFVFCHEDFVIKEDLNLLLTKLSTDSIYGCIGTLIEWKKVQTISGNANHSFPVKYAKSSIIQAEKDGSQKQIIGAPISKATIVDTVDCCCLIVHSSLVNKHKLRFDENLTFDLYSEAFSIEAKEKLGILTKAIQMNCEHWSSGNVGERYYAGLRYLSEKHPNVLYSGTCSFIGGKTVALSRQMVVAFNYILIANKLGLTPLINMAIWAYKKCPDWLKSILRK